MPVLLESYCGERGPGSVWHMEGKRWKGPKHIIRSSGRETALHKPEMCMYSFVVGSSVSAINSARQGFSILRCVSMGVYQSYAGDVYINI